LKPETVDLMAGNAMGDCQVTMLHTVAPGVSNDAEFFPGMSKGWGLSFMINNEQADTGRPAGSLAWAGLANTFLDRPHKRRGRRLLHTDLSLRRYQVVAPVSRIRDDRLSRLITIACRDALTRLPHDHIQRERATTRFPTSTIQ